MTTSDSYVDLSFDTESVTQMPTGPAGPAGGPSPTWPLVTSLPGSPIDGQECYYLADATNGVVWHLRYRTASSSAYKWECVGGSSLSAEVEAQSATVTSTTYIDVSTGPSLVVPLAGDYQVDWGALSSGSVATAIIASSIKRGAAAAVDADALLQQPPGVNYFNAGPGHRRKRMNALAASTTLAMQHKANNGTMNFSNRWLAVQPVRVG
jgi:hypothetical protein